jgi:hypothetical protein
MRVVLDEATWRARAAAHEARVDGWLAGHLDRRRRGRAHPVEDFLFTYYSYRPGQLRAWHPGVGVVLAGARPAREYVATPHGSTVDTAGVLRRRGDSVRWIADLLTRTAARPAQLGCFGLHEWAMVYGQSPAQLRHTAWPLRLSPAKTMSVVEQQRMRCTHFDAYRFFTEPARPLNLLAPTRETQPALEQPGCLHANMDLYKWAYKLAPLTPSELVADCFELAREIRVLDMRASPYDLSGLGLDPVAIETADGRAEYARAQRAFADRAVGLRDRLIRASTVDLVSGPHHDHEDGQPGQPAGDHPSSALSFAVPPQRRAPHQADRPERRLAADAGHCGGGEIGDAGTG